MATHLERYRQINKKKGFNFKLLSLPCVSYGCYAVFLVHKGSINYFCERSFNVTCLDNSNEGFVAINSDTSRVFIIHLFIQIVLVVITLLDRFLDPVRKSENSKEILRAILEKEFYRNEKLKLHDPLIDLENLRKYKARKMKIKNLLQACAKNEEITASDPTEKYFKENEISEDQEEPTDDDWEKQLELLLEEYGMNDTCSKVETSNFCETKESPCFSEENPNIIKTPEYDKVYLKQGLYYDAVPTQISTGCTKKYEELSMEKAKRFAEKANAESSSTWLHSASEYQDFSRKLPKYRMRGTATIQGTARINHTTEPSKPNPKRISRF